MAIIEEAASQPAKLTMADAYEQIRAIGLKTPSESVEMIREDRDRN